MTQTCKQALALLDVRVLDHLIVAGKTVLSLPNGAWFDINEVFDITKFAIRPDTQKIAKKWLCFAPMSPSTATLPFFPSTGRRWHIRLMLVEALFSILPPFTLARNRRLALKACGLHTGRATFFWGNAKLRGRGPIALRLRIGSECGFNDGCEFDLMAPITIGNHVAVGHEVRFLTTRRQDGGADPAPITIGDGVWLGARSTILGGVTVGAGSVIGAGVTVTADVPPNTLVTGAKPVSLAKWR